ncbi:MAG: TauD/TfdA dioxygenase family protein [Beijerinckiaceae bacterium]
MSAVAEDIRLEELKPGLGARVHGIDLNSDDVERHADFLRAAFVNHAALVFTAPDLEPNSQIRLARLFGKADADFVPHPNHPGKRDSDGLPKRGIIFISNKKAEDGENVGSLPDGELHFHSDGAHRKSPYRATTLYSLEIPSIGGETKIADLRAAYDDLTPDMKRKLEGLHVHNVYDTRATLREQTDETNDKLSNAIHPLVRVHPDTGRKSLYLSRLMTRNIVGMDRAESDALLSELFAHIEREKYIYAHPWKVGELLMWDNRSVNHARSDFPASEPRHMRRVTISEPDLAA